MEVKEAPGRLRAVFALFSRRKGAATAQASAGDNGHVKVLDAEAAAPDAAEAQTAAAQPEASPVVAEATTPAAEPQAVAGAAESPAGETDEELPLANYDTLTVASLRARLRTLNVDQLRVLIDYEKAHQGREEVTGMFERRIAKIVAGETTGFQAIS
jgi:hypothetical protein